MQFARNFAVPESEKHVSGRIRDFMRRLGYDTHADSGTLVFHRGSYREMLYSLSPRGTPSTATICLEPDEHETRVSVVVDASLTPSRTRGDLRYFEAELDGLEAAAWGNASAADEASLAEHVVRSDMGRKIEIVLESALLHAAVCLLPLLLYLWLATMIDGRYLIPVGIGLVVIYYVMISRLARVPRALDRLPPEILPPTYSFTLEQRLFIGFTLIAIWLPYAPVSALVVGTVLAISLWLNQQITAPGLKNVMLGTIMVTGVLATIENPAMWGIHGLPGNLLQVAQGAISTPHPASTSTPRPAPTVLPNSAQATATALRQGGQKIFGPAIGSIVHSSTADKLDLGPENNRLRDFVAEATFSNPYDRGEADWDYGFVFRNPGLNRSYRIYVDSYRNWKLSLSEVVGTNQSEIRGVSYGVVPDLDISPKGSNQLRLIASGSTGYLFVNDRYVAQLDFSAQTDMGSVSPGTAFVRGHKLAGRETRFEGLTIWKIPTAEEIAAITHDQASVARDEAKAMALAKSGAKVFSGSGSLIHPNDARLLASPPAEVMANFAAEARFTNPYGRSDRTWDYGFLFRWKDAGYGIHVDSDGNWVFSLVMAPESGGRTRRISSGKLLDIDTNENGSNTLKLVAAESVGYLFVNDRYATKLPLTDKAAEGEIRVVTGFDKGHRMTGKTTAYDNFTVWSLY